jgi:hypothetical protein
MSYQERIYGQCGFCPERNQTVHSVNMSSDFYVFNRPYYDLTGSTKVDCTTPPNSGLTSGDTGVYIISSQTGVTFDFIFTANTQSFTDLNQSKFKYTVHKYNTNLSGFSVNAIYTSELIEWSSFSATSATTQTIPIASINLDGDYIVKGHYVNNIATEFGSLLNEKYDTQRYITSNEYAIYQSDRDFYFVSLKEAEIPQIGQGTNTPLPVGTFIVSSIELTKNQTQIIVADTFQTYIVALNGLTLANFYDYTVTTLTSGSVTTTIIQLVSPAQPGDILTVTYVSIGSSNEIINKIIDISSPIPSGTTGNQGSNSVYYNTTTSKYEIFVDTTPIDSNDIMITVNGAILANNIDYYQSTSDLKRIILEGGLVVGDIINVYYNGFTNLVGDITTPVPTISWSISTPPTNTGGIFIVEVSSASTFTTIISSATTKYAVGELNYYATIPLSGDYGDNFYYRIKNEKQYNTLCNSVVKSIKYSEIIPITLGINSTKSY